MCLAFMLLFPSIGTHPFTKISGAELGPKIVEFGLLDPDVETGAQNETGGVGGLR